jgi:flagellar protein FlaJ
MFVYLPLVCAVLLLVGVLAVPFSRPVERRFNAIAYRLFRRLIDPANQRRERVLRSAGNGTPLRLYATATYLYATIGAVAGVVLGIYLGAYVIDALDVRRITAPAWGDIFRPLPDWLLTFDARYFVLLLCTGFLVGGLIAAVVYAVRWQIPAVRAGTRRRQIEAGLPRTVAFVYALSRGGMAFPDVMGALARHRGGFGTAADEVAVGVRNLELFNEDVVSAMRDLSRRTPSEQFATLAENLSSVLQSGSDLSGFLREEYERFNEEAEAQQREILDLLATVAEVYTTVAVAGVLFLVTILVVIGLTTSGMIGFLQAATYVVIPATNLLFVAFLSEITQPLRATRDSAENGDRESTRSDGGDAPGPQEGDVDGAVAMGDGGTLPGGADGFTDGASHRPTTTVGADSSTDTPTNRARVEAYRRVRGLLETVGNPIDAALRRPTLVLYVTVPVAVVLGVLQLPSATVPGEPIVVALGGWSVTLPGIDVHALDDIVIQSVLFVLATFAVVYEASRRRLERREQELPDLLERLASLNEAGVSIVSSFDRVRDSDMGALDEEIDQIWRDVQWGANVEEALERFEERVRTPQVTRVVTLVTHAIRASNDIGPVLRIAADQARNDRRLKRQRRQEMFTYLVVIYIAFAVFVLVVGAINFVLIPSLPESVGGQGATAGSPFSLAQNAGAYQLLLFHVAIVQSVLSGLVGGQMSEGTVKAGVKHASIMLAIAYVVFLAFEDLGAPSADVLVLLP